MDSPTPIVSKKKLKELLEQVDPLEQLDAEVENALLEIADEFIGNVTKSACQMAKHRQSDTLEIKDLQFVLDHNYNIRIPGFGADEKPIRKVTVSPAHQQRLAQIKKLTAADTADKDKDKSLKKQTTRI